MTGPRYVTVSAHERSEADRMSWGDDFHLVDTHTAQVVWGDDVPPEDMILVRDLKPLVALANDAEALLEAAYDLISSHIEGAEHWKAKAEAHLWPGEEK